MQAEVKRAEDDPRVLAPGATCDMVYKGTIGAKVATMVVDKAVYFLNNGSRLNRKTVSRLFSFHWLVSGCMRGSTHRGAWTRYFA